jgi:hypothetical protein
MLVNIAPDPDFSSGKEKKRDTGPNPGSGRQVFRSKEIMICRFRVFDPYPLTAYVTEKNSISDIFSLFFSKIRLNYFLS